MIILPVTLGVMLVLLGMRFGWSGFERLARQDIKGRRFALAACLAQLISVVTREHRLAWLALTTVLLIVFCWQNRRRPGLMLATAGIALNVAVMTANAGMMPINSTTVARMRGTDVGPAEDVTFWKGRVLADDRAVLPWLGDRLLLPGPLGRLAAWSIGDVLLLAGIGRLLWHTMKGTDSDRRTVWDQTTAC